MRRRSALAALAGSGAAFGAETREPAPDFVGKTIKGEKFSKDSLKGKVVLLQFWATWCGYCRRDEPAVDTVLRDFSAQGLIVLGVNVRESKEMVLEYLAKHPRACKVVLTEDTNLTSMVPTNAFPLYILLDREGLVAGIQKGSGGEEMLRRLLKLVQLER
ncbi:MAG: TlpA family protein disulfide reductase [Bryobacterales bacterium]|nr:TlpA family protein disulfide reductase [Bryobacterales bacterium]